MQSAVIKHENNLKNIYSESRVANFDDYVKKKDRFRHTLLHWHQIPRANNPEKPLQNNALNILSVVVFKLKMQKIVVLNQNYLSPSWNTKKTKPLAHAGYKVPGYVLGVPQI